MELLEQQEYLIEEDNLGEGASGLVEIGARDKTIGELTNRELLDTFLAWQTIQDVHDDRSGYMARRGTGETGPLI